jgi:hypothetical protein
LAAVAIATCEQKQRLIMHFTSYEIETRLTTLSFDEADNFKSMLTIRFISYFNIWCNYSEVAAKWVSSKPLLLTALILFKAQAKI